MYIKIHSTKNYIGGNTRSCCELVKYLSKENEGKELLDQENFFNSQGKDFSDFQVISSIDQNVKGLHKKEARFFMLSINPSKKELSYLAFKATSKKINDLAQMSPSEKEKYNQLFKDYVNDCMEFYAQGFNKDLCREDILYFAKVEKIREYKYTDKQVKEHNAKEGEPKPGLQTHCHIIVSRKDRSMSKSISPLANSKGESNKHKLNGKSVKVGFNRDKYMLECETLFDIKYKYSRSIEDFYLSHKVDKHILHLSHVQYESYLKNLANFHEQTKDIETQSLINLAKGIKEGSLYKIGNSSIDIMGVGDLKNEEFNHQPPTIQLVQWVKNIIAGNPVKISKELVKGSQGLEM
ncbi:MAG: DUF5712 family protein [Bacteroidota bacterium]|nr:DUF5712 family protein [Bacteroidota bacterium]